jgi:hypothetical protein
MKRIVNISFSFCCGKNVDFPFNHRIRAAYAFFTCLEKRGRGAMSEVD